MNIPRGKYIAKNADPDKHEAEHFFICETCGGWIDCHDLGSVFDHEGLYITCRRKIESTRVNQMPWSRSTLGRSICLAVPDLTRNADVQLNERVSLQRHFRILSST